jgi:hypothetical protein
LAAPFDPWGGAWEPASQDHAAAALARLASAAAPFFAGAGLVGARSVVLPFYAAHRLLELHLERGGATERVFVLHGPDATRWLNGESAPIYETNAAESLRLTDETVVDYLRFYLYFLRADAGAFVLVESEDELAAQGDRDDSSLRSRVTPLTIRSIDGAGRWVIEGSVAYEGYFFLATFAVAPDGLIEMVDDEPVGPLDGITVPEYPALELAPLETPLAAGGGEEAGDEGLAHRERAASVRDRDVTEAVVAVLLEDALREREADQDLLLRHFNVATQTDKPIDRLTRLVSGSVPVIIVESDIPFVEDFVAGLVDGPGQAVTGGAVARA